MSKIQLGDLNSIAQLDVLSLEEQEIVNGGKKKQPKNPPKRPNNDDTFTIRADSKGNVELGLDIKF